MQTGNQKQVYQTCELGSNVLMAHTEYAQSILYTICAAYYIHAVRACQVAS